jgi:UDP-glucose 4-epimerase/dTDP-L-rhamnose 4-epimerase
MPYSYAALAGRRVLVTGGAGLIGSRIAARLRAVGARPVVLCSQDAYPANVYQDLFGVDFENPDTVPGDVRDRALVERTVAGCDFVVHAAALADVAACTRTPQAAIDTNITGTQTVLDAVAAADHVQRLVYVSSASVYGNGSPPDTEDAHLLASRELLAQVYGRTPPRFHEETSARRPMSVYANTKAWGEVQAALTLHPVGVSYTVVRYFSVYGEPQVIKPGSHSWVVAWFAARAALGLPLHLNGGGHQVRDFVHVDDVADATVRALTAPRAHAETLNIATGTATSIRGVAALVRTHYPRTTLLETPMPPGDPLGGYAATHRAEQFLGWRHRITLAEGVARYVRWLRAHPQAIPGWLRESAGVR